MVLVTLEGRFETNKELKGYKNKKSVKAGAPSPETVLAVSLGWHVTPSFSTKTKQAINTSHWL